MADEELHIEVDHSAYYRWVPVRDEEVQEGDLVTDSTFEGFKMKQVVVNEPSTTTTTVHLPSLQRINDDRAAAGLGRRSHKANLVRHLEDGPWYKHFPEGTITALRCDDPKWQQWLSDHFIDGTVEDEDYSVAPAPLNEEEQQNAQQ